MRSLTLATAAAAVLLSTGCAGTPAPAAAPSTPPSSPAAATTQAASDADPACSSPELDDVLQGIGRYDERGAFDAKTRTELDPDDVSGWHWSLRRLEDSAGPKLRQAAAGAREVMGKWINADPGSDEQLLHAVEIGLVATTLELTCR
jgi:hypothetical protein